MNRQLQYEKHEDFMKRQYNLELQANKQSDVIKNPRHYEQYEFEPVSFIMKNELSFWMGNVIKYIMRAGTKENTEKGNDRTDKNSNVSDAVFLGSCAGAPGTEKAPQKRR